MKLFSIIGIATIQSTSEKDTRIRIYNTVIKSDKTERDVQLWKRDIMPQNPEDFFKNWKGEQPQKRYLENGNNI